MNSNHVDRIERGKFDDLASSNERRILNSDSEYLSNYTLTIGEASSLMHIERCKFASNRKVQRMCKEGRIDCWKLSTTRNGQPVAEWLVNETSLRNHIDKHEIKWDGDDAKSPSASLLANRLGHGNAIAAPDGFGNASMNPADDKKPVSAPDAVAMPNQLGNASGSTDGDARNRKSQAITAEDMAMPIENGDANNREIGETRSLASLLIENARLTAELEGKRELETEMRDEKLFLREELKEARAGRKDVAAIAERMLETLETIATGGKLMSASRASRHNRHAPVSHSDTSRYRESESPENNVVVEVTNAENPIFYEHNQPMKNDDQKPENPFYI